MGKEEEVVVVKKNFFTENQLVYIALFFSLCHCLRLWLWKNGAGYSEREEGNNEA